MDMIDINPLLQIYLLVYLISSLSDLTIDLINNRHLKKVGNTIPTVLKDIIDEEKLRKMNQYSIDNTRLSVIKTVVAKFIFLGIILFGFLPFIVGFIKDLHFIPAGLIFFAVLGVIATLVDLPFDYYHIFRIEERYGFNTRTIKIWLSDLLKSLVITVFLGSALLSLLLIIIRYAGNLWWMWAWLFFFLFQLLMTALYPTVIAPLFNRFIPIQNDKLVEKIRDLTNKEGLHVKDIFQMDAARRSRHTNAYFSGLGKTKRIVLYDTLLKSHDEEEILAILSHEIGHLKRRHIIKQICIMGMVTFLLFFLASQMITWEAMYRSFGFSEIYPYVGLLLIATLWEPLEFFLSPLAMALSRKFEREADHYVLKAIKTSEPFVEALKKIARDNLANLYPHSLYIRFNYSHPPLLERIKNLREMAIK